MKPVRWGILGVSKHFLTRVLPAMKKSTVSIPYAIASRDCAKAKTAAKTYVLPVSYGSYKELLADRDIEAVFIPLPNNLHLEWIKRGADAGKHILCEKPITMNAIEAREAAEYAQSKGVMLMEAFMYRFHPRWAYVKELVSMGGIGAVVSVNVFFGYNNTDMNNIRNKVETGGGALYDIGCYAVSVARWLIGREPKRVVSLVERDVTATDTLVSAILDFGGAHSDFAIGTRLFQGQRVDVQGTGGSIHIPLPFNMYVDTEATMTVTTGLGSRDVRFAPADQYGLEMDAFSRALRESGAVPTPVGDAIANMAVLDALFRSGESGTWETV